MARNDPQVNLRYPADLKRRLDEAAAANRRSLTAEMINRLEQSFAGAVLLPKQLLDRLQAEAEENHRDLESEIFYRLLLSVGDTGPEMVLRVPEDMQKRIAASAASHDQSVNEEVLVILRRYFPNPRTPREVAARLEEMIEVLEPAASYEGVDRLLERLQKFAHDLGGGHIAVDQATAEEVADRYTRFEEDEFKQISADYGVAGEDE